MDVVTRFPADPQAAGPVQVGERALHDPALGAQAGAVLSAPAGDQRLHAEIPDQVAVLVVVVAPSPSTTSGRRRRRPRWLRTGGTASSSGISWVTTTKTPPPLSCTTSCHLRTGPSTHRVPSSASPALRRGEGFVEQGDEFVPAVCGVRNPWPVRCAAGALEAGAGGAVGSAGQPEGGVGAARRGGDRFELQLEGVVADVAVGVVVRLE